MLRVAWLCWSVPVSFVPSHAWLWPTAHYGVGFYALPLSHVLQRFFSTHWSSVTQIACTFAVLLKPQNNPIIYVLLFPGNCGPKTIKFGKLIRRIFKWLNTNLDCSVTFFTLGLRGRYSNWTMCMKHEKDHSYFTTWYAMWDIISLRYTIIWFATENR